MKLCNGTYEISEDALEEQFTHAGGPGGQNVNKVATAVLLRFVLDRAGLPEPVHQRIETTLRSRLTADGDLLIHARRYRNQERNRDDARERLRILLEKALHKKKKRVPTKPSFAARKERLKEKKQRSDIKRSRQRPSLDSE